MEIFQSKHIQNQSFDRFVIKDWVAEKEWHTCFIPFVLFSAIIISGCKTPPEKSNYAIMSEVEVENKFRDEEVDIKYEEELDLFKRISNIRISRNEKIITEVEDQINMKENQLDTSLKKKAAWLKQKNQMLKQTLNEHLVSNNRLEWKSRKINFEKDMRLLESEI